MSKSFDYTKYARRFATRFPVFNYLLSQIFFWMLAYALLAILAHLVLVSAGPILSGKTSLKAALFIALFFGFFTGIVSGYAGRFFEKKLFYNKAIGIIILSKAIISLIVFVILISVVRSVLYPYLLKRFLNNSNPENLKYHGMLFFTCC
jgi:hypothetical protein